MRLCRVKLVILTQRGRISLTRTLRKIRESVCFVPLATGKGELSVASVWRTLAQQGLLPCIMRYSIILIGISGYPF